MASLSLRHIYKIYPGNVKAVSDFNLEIDDKEFIVFVGPSGCGKSTTLRMVAGLEEITRGELYIDGKLVNDVEPKDRDIAMVFQNYALYPHMTVYDNMAFGLKLRRMKSAEIKQRVNEAAQILGIAPLLTRKPKALSGGQRQRVALGRAIVREPKVFLLDEPLSNLDAKLRVQMRTEITKLHNKLATTFIYVTHDQVEAMTMGTRIVVMKDGIAQQIDTPQNLYDNPVNLFVASFIGTPQMNFFKAVLSIENGEMFASFGSNKIKVPHNRAKRLMDMTYIGKEIIMGVRPEDIHDEEIFINNSPDTVISAYIDVIEKLGNETILYMKVDGKEDYTVARIDARSKSTSGEELKLAIDANHIHFFDADTELTIMGVPRINMIPAKLLAEGDKVCLKFGHTSIDLSQELVSKLVDTNYINCDVNLGVCPDDLYDKKQCDAQIAELSAEINNLYAQKESIETWIGKSTVQLGELDAESQEATTLRNQIAEASANDRAIEANIMSLNNQIDQKQRFYEDMAGVICGEVDFVEKYPRYTALYNKVPGKKGFMVSKVGINDNFVNGEPVELKFDVNKIQLYDADSGEKILASRPLSQNCIQASVSSNGDTASVRFGKNAISCQADGCLSSSGAKTLYLDCKGIEVGKEACARNPKKVLQGKVLDYDILGDNSLLYLQVDGVDNYFTGIVSGPVAYNENEKIKFVVSDQVKEYVQPIDELIKDKALVAPQYVFVDEAAIKRAEAAVVATAPKSAVAPEKTKSAPKKKPAAKKSGGTSSSKVAKTVRVTTAAKPAAKPASKKPTAKKPVATKSPASKKPTGPSEDW